MDDDSFSTSPMVAGTWPATNNIEMFVTAKIGIDECCMFDGSTAIMDQYRSPLSAVGSSITTSSPHTTRRPSLDSTGLLELCEEVRASLVHGKVLDTRWEEAMGFLKTTLEVERRGMDKISLEDIEHAHLDMLLCDIIDPENRPKPTPSRFRDDVALAQSLQKAWRARLRGAYFSIGTDRYLNLTKTGRLKDVVFDDKSTSASRLDFWVPVDTSKELSEREGNMQFEPGHWWLNLACANRDGIVSSVRETPSRSTYGITSLPLLGGKEDVYASRNLCRFMKEGRIDEMHVSLITQVGKRIRILRGHCLQSPLAPRAGVRYDGLYILRQYGQKYNEHTDLHRVCLTLERVVGQHPIELVSKVPRPSELDDWDWFQKVESHMIRAKQGDRGLLEWKKLRVLEKGKREQYRRELSFQAAVESEKLDLAKQVRRVSDM